MFGNLFGEKPVYPDPSYVEPVKVPVVNDIQPAYQVGVTPDGRVSLKIGGDSTWSATLLMNNDGIDTLVRMLEAAKNQPVSACDSEE